MARRSLVHRRPPTDNRQRWLELNVTNPPLPYARLPLLVGLYAGLASGDRSGRVGARRTPLAIP